MPSTATPSPTPPTAISSPTSPAAGSSPKSSHTAASSPPSLYVSRASSAAPLATASAMRSAVWRRTRRRRPTVADGLRKREERTFGVKLRSRGSVEIDSCSLASAAAVSVVPFASLSIARSKANTSLHRSKSMANWALPLPPRRPAEPTAAPAAAGPASPDGCEGALNFQWPGPAQHWPVCSKRCTRSRAASSCRLCLAGESSCCASSIYSSSEREPAAAPSSAPASTADSCRRKASSRTATCASASGSSPAASSASNASSSSGAVAAAHAPASSWWTGSGPSSLSSSQSKPPGSSASSSDASASAAWTATAERSAESKVPSLPVVTPVRIEPTMPARSAQTCISSRPRGMSPLSMASGMRAGGAALATAAPRASEESKERTFPGRTGRLSRSKPLAPPSSNLADVRWKSGSTAKAISSFFRSSDVGLTSRFVLGGLTRRGRFASLAGMPDSSPSPSSPSPASSHVGASSLASPPLARLSPPMSL
mmetsp:Transcript_9435/g.31349  ORF Transcript_9435/g.31349 Transcript_9435/m.31349 type:complete len:485 (-) Transcript_9435:474-1928(-)